MRDIRYATLIHAPREDVFRAVATADGWNGWYTSECELDPVPGGVFHPVWRDFGPNRTSKSDVGRVVEVSAPERIVFEWTPVGSENPTQFTFTLKAHAEGTVVQLVDEGYPDDDGDDVDALLDCACAWGEALTLLRFHVEGRWSRGRA